MRHIGKHVKWLFVVIATYLSLSRNIYVFSHAAILIFNKLVLPPRMRRMPHVVSVAMQFMHMSRIACAASEIAAIGIDCPGNFCLLHPGTQ